MQHAHARQPLPSTCHHDATSLALKPWCVASTMQQTLLANLFLLQATVLVMQHFSLRNHGVLHQRCNKPLPLTLSSCRHSDATSLSAHKLGPFLWSGGVLQHSTLLSPPESIWTPLDSTGLFTKYSQVHILMQTGVHSTPVQSSPLHLDIVK